MNKYIKIIFILFLFDALIGQDVESFVKMAIEHNPGLESLRLDHLAAKEKANQVLDYPDPVVNLGIGVLPIETRLGAQRFKIGIRQAIPWKGLLSARKESRLFMAEALEYKDDVKKIDIAYAIRTAYNALVFIEDRLEIIQEKMNTLDVIEEIAKSAVSSGKGKLSNILLIQRTRESLQSDLLLLDKQREDPTIMINRWTGRPLDLSIDVVEPEQSINTREERLNFAKEQHPEFLIINRNIAASEKRIELTQLESKPKLGVGLEYALIDGRNDIKNLPGNGRDVIMPMGSISIPLHTGRYESKRQEEKIIQESLSALRAEKQESYLAELATAQSKIELSHLETQKMNQLKQITSETIDLMQSEYAAEGTRFEELLRLEMELIDYDVMIAKANYDALTAIAILQKFQILKK